jgi:orotate phosphoribosyltransferase
MNEPEIMQKFASVGAIVRDSHFVYTSGRHGSVYVNKDALYVHPEVISVLCQRMAEAYDADSVDVVVAPVLGGIVLSQWVAHALNQRRGGEGNHKGLPLQRLPRETLAVFVEKSSGSTDKRFLFTRGYDRYIAGKNILIVEDVLATGGSVRRVIELVRQHGGHIVGVSVLCNRGNVQPHNIGDVQINALIELDLQTYAAEACPLCELGVPVNTELGKGRVFLAQKM